MKFVNVLVPLLFLALLANCSLDIAIEDVRANDFAKSSILSTSRGVGDGLTGATITVLLKNSDNTVVVGHKPEFDFINESGSAYEGEGITYVECTNSNNLGISNCMIKAITVGSKKVLFNNILIELFSDVYFDPPERNGTFMQIVSSAQIKQDADGYSVTSHTGVPFTGLRQDEGGYIIYTSTTGSITPTE